MMAYEKHSNGASFVVTVLINNKPIREYNEDGQRVCRIPFGSEYSLKIKNKSLLRAKAEISLDGTDVLGNRTIVIPGLGDVVVERFVTDLNGGKKFKFISLEEGEKTGQIQDPTSPENGNICVKVYPEKITQWFTSTSDSPTGIFTRLPSSPTWVTSDSSFYGGTQGCSGSSILRNAGVANTTFSVSASSTPTSNVFVAQEISDAGGTAEGSQSSQKFGVDHSYWETESTPVTFDIKLKGLIEQAFQGPLIKYFCQEKKGSYWLENMQGSKIEVSFVKLSEGTLTFLTKDFSLAQSFPKECLKITSEGFEVSTKNFQTHRY